MDLIKGGVHRGDSTPKEEHTEVAQLPETIYFRPFAVHLHHRHEWQLAHLQRAASDIKDTVKSMIERQVLIRGTKTNL